MKRLMTALWPDSLRGRLVLILVAGMFSAQLFTSTIWSQAYDNRALEIPARLFASRLADTVRLLDGVTDEAMRRHIVERLGDARYRFTWIKPEALQTAVSIPGPFSTQTVNDLISGVIQRRLGQAIDVRVLDAHLLNEAGKKFDLLSLFDSRMPMGDFHVQMRLPTGDVLDVHADEGQAGMQTEPRTAVFGYLVRVYLLRLLAIFLFAFVAVRLAVRPLKRLTDAAETLGKNIHRPPLRIVGPREVRSAAVSFNAMQTLLIESIASKTRMLTAISHDLRSPLTRLRLRVEMLPDAPSRDRLRDDLEDMEVMVRGTLNALQGVDVTEERRDIDMNSMLEGLVEDAREAGESILLKGSAMQPLAGYPRNLKRCLQNLIDNAVYHGGDVSINVNDTPAQLTIIISDRGPGIDDPAMLERVFEPYFRLGQGESDNASDGAGVRSVEQARPVPHGTGLGLTISRSIAEAHGGTVILRNRAERGLDAVLTLQREMAG
jgi:signal transduction histidine kinase